MRFFFLTAHQDKIHFHRFANFQKVQLNLEMGQTFLYTHTHTHAHSHSIFTRSSCLHGESFPSLRVFHIRDAMKQQKGSSSVGKSVKKLYRNLCSQQMCADRKAGNEQMKVRAIQKK
jgi:hypothetical protein